MGCLQYIVFKRHNTDLRSELCWFIMLMHEGLPSVIWIGKEDVMMTMTV